MILTAPAEVVHEILLGLPLNCDLLSIGLAWKDGFSQIFESTQFAQEHLVRQYKDQLSLRFIGSSPKRLLLPNNYKVALFLKHLKVGREPESLRFLWHSVAPVSISKILHQVLALPGFESAYDCNRMLTMSAMKGCTSVAAALVQLPSVRVHRTSIGQAFCVAASFGQINILQMLVQRGELFDYSVIEVVVEEAVKDRDTKVLEFLLETPNPIPCPWPAGRDVAIAAEIGYTDYVKLLLAHNIDPTVDKNYPLRIASRKGHADIVRLLLADKRVNPQAEFNAAIYHAATNGYTGIVRQLLKSGAWPDVDGGNSPLQTACTNGHVEIVKALLETGKVSAAGPCNMPIFLAAEHGHADVVELLLQNGVEPSDCLSNAVLKGHINVVRVLLKCERVDPTLFNNHALQTAVELGNLEVAKLLVHDKRVDSSQSVYAQLSLVNWFHWEKFIDDSLLDGRFNWHYEGEEDDDGWISDDE